MMAGESPMDMSLQNQIENGAMADALLDIIITNDQQTVFAEISPPQNGGRDLSQNEMMACLAKSHIIFGINTDQLASMAVAPEYGKKIIIAQGTLPTEGTDAKLEYHFSIDRELRPKEREDGTVDYRDLGLILSVKSGEKLCTLTPAVKGTPGKTVTGKTLLPHPIKNLMLPTGKNTKVSDDKLVLYAVTAGCIEVVDGKVNVLNIFTVTGNVDSSRGNIQFDGNVVVSGDVLTGFVVSATGKVEILGIVEGATIEAGSDVKIKGGLIGHGAVSSGGNFTTRFIENSSVLARGEVTADSVIHSQIKCGGSLAVDGRHGVIVGGLCIVGKDVKALTIGSSSNISTTLELGIDPTLSARLKTVENRMRQLIKELDRLTQIINMLSTLAAANKLTNDRAEMLSKALSTQKANNQELTDLKKEQTELAGVMQTIWGSQVVCRKDMFAGVKISIGQQSFAVSKDMMRCRIYISADKEIAVGTIV
jgi:uncharacterized protein (DUF342 family)